MTAGFEHGTGAREVQDRFDTRRLADTLTQMTVHATITDGDRGFIEHDGGCAGAEPCVFGMADSQTGDIGDEIAHFAGHCRA